MSYAALIETLVGIAEDAEPVTVDYGLAPGFIHDELWGPGKPLGVRRFGFRWDSDTPVQLDAVGPQRHERAMRLVVGYPRFLAHAVLDRVLAQDSRTLLYAFKDTTKWNLSSGVLVLLSDFSFSRRALSDDVEALEMSFTAHHRSVD